MQVARTQARRAAKPGRKVQHRRQILEDGVKPRELLAHARWQQQKKKKKRKVRPQL